MGKLPRYLFGWLFCDSCFWLRRSLLGITFLGLSVTLSGRFYWEPTLKVGTIVTKDIIVPRDITIEDPEATYAAKQKAQQKVLPVYKVDEDASLRSRQQLEQLFLAGDKIRELAGGMPYLTLEGLSLEHQQLLRRMSDAEWQVVQKEALLSSAPTKPLAQVLQQIHRKSPQQFQAIVTQTDRVRRSYKKALEELRANPLYTTIWLDTSDPEWELDKYKARESLEQLLAEGIVPGLPPELIERRWQSLPLLPQDKERQRVVLNLLRQVATPNLVPDYNAMALQAIQAADSIGPQLVSLKAGQVLILAGQKITSRDFIFLDQLGLARRRPNLARIALVMIMVGIGLAGFALVLSAPRFQNLKNRDLAVFALTVWGIALTTILVPAPYLMFIPYASLGFILGSFYGARLATATSLLLTLPLLVSLPGSLLSYLPLLAGGIAAAMITDRPQARSHLARMGLVIGVLQGGVYALLSLSTGGVVPVTILLTSLQFAAGGVVSSMIALGAIPYLEQIAYTLTPIRLAELANLDRPLLRRLVNEAPGTFQHTLFVANLAEAGARALGADTDLVRTGTLYHDVGKTLHPEFFIENQMGCPNPHDRLDDPWRSAQIIKEHVTGGIKLAQKYHLPEILQAFIPEHQGTIVISYFYHKAKNLNPAIEETDFRYDGPAPQSRETGIVMLADACEAALRSLGTESDLEKAQAMVMRIFQARWDDGQLKDSGLTWSDLEILAPVFIQVWQQRNHGRIKYPDLAKKLDPTGSAIPETKFPLVTMEK